MKSSKIKFLLVVAIAAALCAVAEYFWSSHLAGAMQMHHAYWLLAFFVVSVLLNHFFLLRSAAAPGTVFIRNFLLSTVFKFMLYIFLLVVFLLFSAENKTALILHFLLYYLVFSVIEVVMLYSALQELKPRN